MDWTVRCFDALRSQFFQSPILAKTICGDAKNPRRGNSFFECVARRCRALRPRQRNDAFRRHFPVRSRRSESGIFCPRTSHNFCRLAFRSLRDSRRSPRTISLVWSQKHFPPKASKKFSKKVGTTIVCFRRARREGLHTLRRHFNQCRRSSRGNGFCAPAVETRDSPTATLGVSTILAGSTHNPTSLPAYQLPVLFPRTSFLFIF